MQATTLQTTLRALGCHTASVDLVSPLQREECVRRLRERTGSGRMPSGSRSVVGQVGDATFSLRKRIAYRNSFQTNLRGTFVEESRRTRLRCTLGLHPIVAGFMILWFTAVTLVAGGILVAGIYPTTVGSSPNSVPPLSEIDVPLIMLACGIVLSMFGRALARNEERYLLEFLIRTLEVREVPTTGRHPNLR